MFGVDVQVLKKSHGRQGQSQVHLKFDKMTPVSFAFEEGSGSFSVGVRWRAANVTNCALL